MVQIKVGCSATKRKQAKPKILENIKIDAKEIKMEKKEGDLKKSIYGLAQRRDRLRAENSRLMALNSLSLLEDTSQMSDDRKLENSTRPQARIKSDKAEPQELPTPKTLSAREIGKFDFWVTFVDEASVCTIFHKFTLCIFQNF